MPCRPVHVSLEVNPSQTEKIVFILDKICDGNDDATWKMTFELQEGSPLATVVNFRVEIGPENDPQAAATAATGLDSNQQGQAKIAAAVARDPTASDDDKKDAAQQVIAVKELSAVGSGRPQ